jgi:hypothetical protein
MASHTKTCSRCAETIQLEALECRYCGHAFSQEDVSQACRQAESAAALRVRAAEADKTRRKVSVRYVFGVLCAIPTALVLAFAGLCLAVRVFGPKPEELSKVGMALVFAFLTVVLAGPPGLVSLLCFQSARGLRERLDRLEDHGADEAQRVLP